MSSPTNRRATAFDAFFAFLPNLLAFLVILAVGFVIAKIVSGIVRKVGEKAGLDKALHESDAKQYLFVLTAAIGALKIPAVTAFMNQVLAYLPNVIAAIIIFVAAAAIAGAVAGGVAKLLGDTPTGKVVATAVPSLLMGARCSATPTARARSSRASAAGNAPGRSSARLTQRAPEGAS